jgi:hypothetical protein
MGFGPDSVTLSWADWKGYDYDLFKKSSLTNDVWTPVLSGSSETNAVDTLEREGFYKMELQLQPKSR